MSYSGFNISPSASELVPKTYTELEATATPKNIQINLAIMRDTLEVPFSDLNKHDIWKYQSNSSRPTLAPALNIRTASPDTHDEPSVAWQSKYDRLIDELPEEMKNALILNKGLPREEQFASLIAFDHSLIALSKALVIIESGAEPLLRESAAEARRNINERVPGYAQENYERSAYEILGSIDEKLNELGRNHPDYDAISYYSGLSQEALRAITGKTL